MYRIYFCIIGQQKWAEEAESNGIWRYSILGYIKNLERTLSFNITLEGKSGDISSRGPLDPEALEPIAPCPPRQPYRRIMLKDTLFYLKPRSNWSNISPNIYPISHFYILLVEAL